MIDEKKTALIFTKDHYNFFIDRRCDVIYARFRDELSFRYSASLLSEEAYSKAWADLDVCTYLARTNVKHEMLIRLGNNPDVERRVFLKEINDLI
jgi:hypothetical protein